MKTAIKSLVIVLIASIMAGGLTGCSVTKVEYEKNDKGETSYRLYRNSHWLKMEGEGMRGGMTQDGKFEFDLEGLKSSPSEEFNRTMQTYTTAFVQLAQIAAAAYNPSSSGVAAAKTAEPAQTVVNVQPAAAVTTSDAQASTNAVESVEAK